ncbi:MAG: L(+)-tartrate dehydratase subunit alpha [Lentisphaerae bacterium ADurb.Bin082]|nr:MAG: L(+)-tartrate dehydratase subunit alpha [Lentisphaerae bacterium ADurb.Bin082]
MSFSQNHVQKAFLELIVKASTNLPEDVEQALQAALAKADQDSPEAKALETLLANVALARSNWRPLCQDTGMLLFDITSPPEISRAEIQAAAEAAVAGATELGVLRQNCVNSLTGKNTGNNLGYGCPIFHWQEGGPGVIEASLMLKGGGSENVSAQYSLPDARLSAGRDLDGVRACVLDAVWQAQGRGCAPGILGVAIGGDRATGYEESKRQLFRRIGQRSPHPELAQLEERLVVEANQLGIGPMGFGGKTTVLDVLIGWRCRLPASYFVSISYMCWCCRRQTMTIALP